MLHIVVLYLFVALWLGLWIFTSSKIEPGPMLVFVGTLFLFSAHITSLPVLRPASWLGSAMDLSTVSGSFHALIVLFHGISIVSAVVLLLKSDNPLKKRLCIIFGSIATVTCWTYFCIFTGVAESYNHWNGRKMYPLRFVQWIYTTSAFVLWIVQLGNIPKRDTLVSLSFNYITLIMGFAASVSSGPEKWLALVISLISFGFFLRRIQYFFSCAIRQSYNKVEQKMITSLFHHTLVTWTLIPIFWALDTFEIVSPEAGATLLSLGDILAKAIYPISLLSNSFYTLRQVEEVSLVINETIYTDMVITQERLERTVQLLRDAVKHATKPDNELLVSKFLDALKNGYKSIEQLVAFFTVLLESQFESPHQLNQLSQTLNTSQGVLLSISNIRDYLKFQTESPVPKKKNFTLLKLISDTAKFITNRAPKQFVPILIDYDKELESRTLIGDCFSIFRVLSNVVDNSLKYTQKGNITLKFNSLTPSLEKDSNYTILSITIEDTGIGIDPSKMDTILKCKPIFDEDLTQGSLGLGLLVCRIFVNSMGGTFKISSTSLGTKVHILIQLQSFPDASSISLSDCPVTSLVHPSLRGWIDRHCKEESLTHCPITCLADIELPQGSPVLIIDVHCLENSDFPLLSSILKTERVQVVLLCDKLQRDIYQSTFEDYSNLLIMEKPLIWADFKLKLGVNRSKETLDKKQKPNFWVLLVDDNDLNQKVAGVILRKLGVSFDRAYNGKEAVEATKKKRYHLILMDIQMPVMDGLTAAFEIRKYEQERGILKSFILAVTASHDFEREALLSGMDAYMTKPLVPDVLSSRIESIRAILT